MVHSASVTSWPSNFEKIYLSRHLIFLVFGVLVGWICALLPSRIWFHLAPWLFFISLILLGLVLIPSVGVKINGARRWYRFGPLSLQPSEIVKVTLPLFLGRIVTELRSRNEWNHLLKGTIPLMVPPLLVLPLVVLEPDLGTTIFLALGVGVLLWIAGWPLRNFLLSLLLVVPAVGILISMQPYQKQRIIGFLETWENINKAPYQVKQSLMSLGNGGVYGVGIGKGWQKLSFLPEANTDFVFAVLGEELGLIGTLSVVILWVAVYLSGFKLLSNLSNQSYEKLVALTLLTQIVMQAALNIAVVTAMVPPKGISHPLMSYGGSNLVMTLVAVGVIVGCSKSQPAD